MRLFRYLFVLIVVLSTTAWAAPTQTELPITWTQAALSTQPVAERHVQAGVGRCSRPLQGAAARNCHLLSERAADVGCLPVQECQRIGLGSGLRGAATFRGHINVTFSNPAARADRAYPSAADCVTEPATAVPGIQLRQRPASGCTG